MKNLIDIHTHTISSGHAYSTLQENVQEAVQKGLKYYGISDHAPALPGGTHEYHFSNLRVIPKVLDGVQILKGAELNILDELGSIDLKQHELNELDYTIASLHLVTMAPRTLEYNTNALINAMRNPYIKVIGHPDDGRYELDHEQVVLAAKKYHVVLEVNNSSMSPNTFRANAYENYLILLKWCKTYQVPIICNSDAHISYDVGHIPNSLRVLKEAEFPMELVVNFSEELIQEYILNAKPKE